MTNNINLKSGSGITLNLDTSNDTLSITIDKVGLNTILQDLQDDNGSVLKSILTNIATLNTSISSLTSKVSALENHTAGATETWVRGLIDKYAVNQTNGLIDYGTADPDSSGGANSRAKIYVKY